MRRRAARRRTKAKPPNLAERIDHLAILLANVYWNGSIRRPAPFRITRSKLRELSGIRSLDTLTVLDVVQSMSRRGFVLYPLDANSYTKSRLWIFDEIERLNAYPVSDEYPYKKRARESEPASCMMLKYRLRELAGVSRLDSKTANKIVDAARKRDFIAYPLGDRWIFEPIERLKKYPLLDHYALQRAESQAGSS